MTYSPHDLLPAPEPKTHEYPKDYFYENVAKPLIKDVVRIMDNGLHIDLPKVSDLEDVLNTQLSKITVDLAEHPFITPFSEIRHASLLTKYVEERKTKLKPLEHFLKEFKPSDQVHRSYFMHIYSAEREMTQPTDLLPTGVPKWSAVLVKKLSANNPLLRKLVAKEIKPSHPIAMAAMKLLAEHKQGMYNEKYLSQIKDPQVEPPAFNPGSATQKQELFSHLQIASDKTSKKTGNPSYDKEELDRINKVTVDPLVRSLTQILIDHSSAAIIRNNFIEAFYKFTVDSRLYGSLKLFGAKSFRLTSNKPNMLNMPSTKSVFAKPVKKCFTAPEGFLVAAIDYAALEDRVVASLSRDVNKCAVFLEDIDGHSLAATYYFPERTADIVGPFTDNKAAAKLLKALVDDENSDAIELRQDAKPISFGLAYGAFPKKVAQTIKIPIEDATIIFDAYHEEMYPGISDYRENYVLPTVTNQGYIHLGLGCVIFSDDPARDIRTINNGTVQFWSILTLLTINKLHLLIDEAGYQDDIIVTATIYDSIYFEVRIDPVIIKWLNDTIVPIMETDFMENQTIRNEADLELGTSWADLHKLQHNASIEDITEVIASL